MDLASLKLRVPRLPAWICEVSIFGVFLIFTALMTWPWVTSLRDAVSDTGDPYMITWTLWWDFHQTFHHPLSLFNANIFYPYQYTLAFSEHDYGVALLFFPLFAVGLRPLTIHSIATFSGFAFCGYGAFRLTRTLTNSTGAAWIAGVVFAFVPFRFQLLSHLHYLFAGWIPLLLEALVMFVRVRTWKRAIWLGLAFLMNGLTSISWLILTLIPLTLSAAFLMVRYWREADKRQLLRAIPVLLLASLLLVPFLWPYYRVTQLYHFSWPISEPIKFSAGWSDWFSADPRVKVWQGFGNTLPNRTNHLFPGLLPLLLSVAALFWVQNLTLQTVTTDQSRKRRWLVVLDALAIVAAVIALLGVGFRDAGMKLLAGPTSDRALVVLTLILITRWAIAYPRIFVRSQNRNLIDSIRSPMRCDGFWLGMIWAIAGLLSSAGMSFFLNRVMYEFLFPFRSLRIPARAAMVAYVGIAVLAGVGVMQFARVIAQWQPTMKQSWVYTLVVVALLFELHAAPLAFEHGAVDTDAVSQRLKTMEMRGGIVELPGSTVGFPLHLAMLRAADHQKPLVNAASSFVSPISARIDEFVLGPGVKPELMDLLEQIPASYVVVRHQFITADRKMDFADFFDSNVAAGRLRLVGVYDKNVELYVVTRTEENIASK